MIKGEANLSATVWESNHISFMTCVQLIQPGQISDNLKDPSRWMGNDSYPFVVRGRHIILLMHFLEVNPQRSFMQCEK